MMLNGRWLFVAVLFVFACGADSGTDNVLDADVVSPGEIDEAEGEVQIEVASELTVDLQPDTGEMVEVVDLEEEETSPPDDFGLQCEDDDDCLSGLCVDTSEGQVCTKECDDGCPAGFLCAMTDGLNICLPEFLDLCRPCKGDGDCAGNEWDVDHLCASYGVDGDFCASVCQSEEDCPSGYKCDETFSSEGGLITACVRQVGGCECNPYFAAVGAATSCVNANEWGSCVGERVCEEGGLSPCNGAEAEEEECDLVDNDCDGEVDEDLAAGACTLENEFGVCTGQAVCVEGEYECQGQLPTEEECDGLDNDCDGEIDEEFEDENGDGTPDCLESDVDDDGVFDYKDNCLDVPNPLQEDLDEDGEGDACDNDDDGDGSPDTEDCEPLDPDIYPEAVEKCNLIDDDCDGDVDEDFPDTNDDGIPDCISEDDDGDGVPDVDDNCPSDTNPEQENFDDDGAGDACDLDDDNDQVLDGDDCEPLNPGIYPGAAEECDGVDNNCNAQADEGFEPITCGLGACEHTIEACTEGLLQWCDPMEGVEVETCDGGDNDCDGDVDEELGQTSCGLGPCEHLVDNCVDGETQVCDPLAGAVDEACDAVDNDCDGEVDEDTGGDDCSIENDAGTCVGTDLCIDGQLVCDAAVPAPDECDGLDNDCDGEADEELGQTSCGEGECLHTVPNCIDGVIQECDPMLGAVEEICDGLDNDCDMAVDEELGTTNCGLGVCDHEIDNCVDGLPQLCDPMNGAEDEECDGLDNDCDGNVDEGLGQTTCGVGLCEHTVDNCADGEEQICDPQEGWVEEECDGLDNDCDGEVDESFADFDLDGIADCVDDDDDDDGDLDAADCEPLNPDVGPSRDEVCFNEIDEDCTDDTPDACVLADCMAVLGANADLPDGSYTIDPDGAGPAEPFETLCDMTTGGGGWTLTARLSDDDEKRWAKRYNAEMPETLWFNGTPHGTLEGTADYKNSGLDLLVATDLLLTVHSKESSDLIYGVWGDGICDGENPLPGQAVWTEASCVQYTPALAVKSGEIGEKPGGGYIHGLMLGPNDGDKVNLCVKNGTVPGIADDLSNGGSGYGPPETSLLAIGSNAAGSSNNPNPQGFSNWHNEGFNDFAALVQNTNIYNFGMLTTTNYGLLWVR